MLNALKHKGTCYECTQLSRTHPCTAGTSIEWDDGLLRSPDMSASLAKSVSWSIRRADFRDSSRRTSSSLFFSSSGPWNNRTLSCCWMTCCCSAGTLHRSVQTVALRCLPFPRTRHSLLPLWSAEAVANLVQRLYEKCLLNIPCKIFELSIANFGLNFKHG
jgi:hypothetical protein